MLDDNKIVINNIRDNIPEELILYSLESNLYNKEYQKSSFLVKKEKLKDGKILIAYKKLEYSFTDYLSDIL
ncbi:MAG: hypothetical protein LBQ59_04890 [Candidatus Peribacteria bacterium]|nr:hypothetical protein [Candidatus Peribacteria bacterium]